jgi:hypothetical protein
MEQGFKPEYTIADGGTGLRAGQKAVMPETPAMEMCSIFSIRVRALSTALFVKRWEPPPGAKPWSRRWQRPNRRLRATVSRKN